MPRECGASSNRRRQRLNRESTAYWIVRRSLSPSGSGYFASWCLTHRDISCSPIQLRCSLHPLPRSCRARPRALVSTLKFFAPVPIARSTRLSRASRPERGMSVLTRSELGCRSGQKFPIRALFLPVHQDVEIGGAFLAISDGLGFAHPVKPHDRCGADDTNMGVLVF